MDQHHLIELVNAKMPFGKFKGRFLTDLPEHYIVWYHRKGFPKGKLGMMLYTMYEIKLNGLESILTPIKQKFRKFD